MRGILLGAALLGLVPPAAAGVYTTDAAGPLRPLADAAALRVRTAVLMMRGAGVAPPGPLDPGSPRAILLKRVAALEAARSSGAFSTLDRVNLGACYIRLNRLDDALSVLRKGPQDHFLVQLNLASAFFLKGDLGSAVACQVNGLDLWPAVWAWPPAERALFHECEKYFLRLLRSRLAEQRRPAGGMVDVDPLFPGLRLVGPRGGYTAGGLPQRVSDHEPGRMAPATAYAVVAQLAWWYPQDFRLYWLLGELLNATGWVIEADKIVAELADAGYGGAFKGLMQHRKVLRAGARVLKVWLDPDVEAAMLAVMMGVPRGALAPPGAGTAAQQASAVAAMDFARYQKQAEGGQRFGPPPEPPADPAAERPLPFNWRHVTVGFLFGFLVAALLGFQWQEWRRRRSQEPPEVEEAGPAPGASYPADAAQETGIKAQETSVRSREG